MLPTLDPKSGLEQDYKDYLSALKLSGFEGDIELDYSSRLAVATDNSIYQRLPQAVLLPKNLQDLTKIGEAAAQFPSVQFSPRGGGTGTNGQSLTSGIVVDLSRHMNQILEINAEEKWVRVQAGVVKDQLNDALRPFGLFFAPDLSTSNRATIGGMINTDASGQGSLVYGKTSEHILGLTSVLADGTVLHSNPLNVEQAKKNDTSPRVAKIIKQVLDTCIGKRQQIVEKFPPLNRFLTGYDLHHGVNNNLSEMDISRLIAGSEGTLAFVAEATLNVTAIPAHTALLNIKYDSFESALRHAPHLVKANATSVETVDSKVLDLARQDIVWHSVQSLIQDVPDKQMAGLNMVEYNSEDQQDIEQRIETLTAQLNENIASGEHGVIGFQITFDKSDIRKIYGMRKKAVGLLGKAPGWQKPIAFAEDTAVPPENLADFILEFRAILDAHNLQYGMFGHVDAGVLHVRPALDMCDPAQQQLMQDISRQVVDLVARYGGLMWGEHGKGYRSEFGPAFFGEELFTELRKIKAAFDPHNQMNPGKICTPIESEDSLVSICDPMRGDHDRQIPISVRDSFSSAMSCNGNGLCFNYDTRSPMCPSSKVTRDRRHSPKGRAGMVREWLRLLSTQNVDIQQLEQSGDSAPWWKKMFRKPSTEDFNYQVKEVMDGCLACKACASQCPVNVDVPDFRARFLSVYYQRYMRPLKDHMVGNIERMAPLMARMPKLVNAILNNGLIQSRLSAWIGYVDTPLLSVPTLQERLAENNHEVFDFDALSKLSKQQKQQTVLLVQDPFTSFYEADLISDTMTFLRKMGYRPVVVPFKPNGKPQHVKGFLKAFSRTAQSTSAFLNRVAALGIDMIGVDASLVLCYRDEYSKILGNQRGDFHVAMLHEWLISRDLSNQATTRLADNQDNENKYALLAHCTEKTALPKSEQQWQAIFQNMGLQLEIVPVGCCGMAGTFGHEREHVEQSRQIYALSWQQAVNQYASHQIVATGYSCRSQVARIEQYKPRHPVQVLLSHL